MEFKTILILFLGTTLFGGLIAWFFKKSSQGKLPGETDQFKRFINSF